MAIFQWKGIEGSQIASGEIEAANKEEATEKLKEKKIVVTNMVLISGKEVATDKSKELAEENSQKQETQLEKNSKFKAKKIKNRDLVMFTKKFATMVEAGLPILKTLRMLEEQQENPNFQWVVRNVCENVEAGSTLSEAFGNHPMIFDTIYINLIKAGETSGKLTLFLRRLVIQLEKAEKIRAKVKSALMYPIILLCVAAAVIAIMLIKVVPVFQRMFASMNNALPAPTELIISISEFLRDPAGGGVLLGLIIAGYFGTKYMLKTNRNFKKKFDGWMLKLPILGDVIQNSNLAKIAMIEGNLAAAGVSVMESLDITAKTLTNTVYIDAFDGIKDGVSSGNTLSSLYSTFDIFPTTFHQMLAVGEETGNMEEMFEATANYYEEAFDMTVDRMTEMLEPIMIVFMGLTVGFIIVAMYMPIFQIGDMVS